LGELRVRDGEQGKMANKIETICGGVVEEQYFHKIDIFIVALRPTQFWLLSTGISTELYRDFTRKRLFFHKKCII
jgi:hypothetical protein